jgi:glutamyl-tRNA synthetase
MAETAADRTKFEAQGRKGTVRLKMPSDGFCEFEDHIRGQMKVAWQQEADHVIQRADGTCLYNLANVVDDFDMKISHVIRAEEHLSNTPRQIFIAQGLGYPLPQYAHVPFVAEPGSKNKLSKRKIANYLKNPDFKKVYEHGENVAKQIGLTVGADTFNPVIVDFYQQVGYLPHAVVNYLLLLGWALDDKTEFFTREAMIQAFSLERVNKAAASFDPKKLFAFQEHYMQELPLDPKVSMALPFLEKAKLIPPSPPAAVTTKVREIVRAAGDRIKVAGDVLDYRHFFQPADQLAYDEKAFEKNLRTKPKSVELLRLFKERLQSVEPFDAPALEKAATEFVNSQSTELKELIHALRTAVSGVAIGFGLYETLTILGKPECVARIDRALARL